MSWFKDERARRLDQVTRQADETLTYYRDLVERLESKPLREELVGAIEQQEGLLRRLRQCRRAQGELPQAGDPERGHLQALLAEARSMLVADEHDPAIIDGLLETTAKLQAEVSDALKIDDLAADEATVLAAYRDAVAVLATRLQTWRT
jgi:hypothetical protein